jgi:hypothetical protein
MLSASEVFEHLTDQHAAPVLIQLLDSEHDTVREWARWSATSGHIR